MPGTPSSLSPTPSGRLFRATAVRIVMSGLLVLVSSGALLVIVALLRGTLTHM